MLKFVVYSQINIVKKVLLSLGSCLPLQGKLLKPMIIHLLFIRYQSSKIMYFMFSPPPDEGFSPETYIIGPEEDLPRKLECMEFVMHAPSDYYKLKNTPYPPPPTEHGTGYIWTTLRNEIATCKK